MVVIINVLGILAGAVVLVMTLVNIYLPEVVFDALLMLHGEDPFCEEYIPSKLYEYLWMQRPVIGLVWRNPHLERLLRAQGHWAIAADDVEAIAAALRELTARWEAGDLNDSGRPSPYTSRAAAERLVGWVDEILAARQAAHR